MNLIGISWKSIRHKPLGTLLSLILFVLGVGLISLLILINSQLQEKFEKNQGGVNLVVGAKGSPLQLILCNIYHIDNPTGNISLGEAKAFLNPAHPLIKMSVPLSLGDSYRNFRIVGTTHDYLNIYNGKIEEGKLWESAFEVCLGSSVAKNLNLKVGDRFNSTHGLGATIMEHDEHDFNVVGILEQTGSVLDQLILTDLTGIWQSHEEHSDKEENKSALDSSHVGNPANEETHDHDDHAAEEDHSGHGHSHDGIYTREELFEFAGHDPEHEITSMLIFFRSETDFRSLNLGRGINENTDMQAANPAYQTARLFEMMGVGDKALRILALIIVIVSALSVFISLFNSLKERKYELAIMRVMGASRFKLFILVVLEGLLIAILGYILGIAVSHLAMEVLAHYMQDSYQYTFTGMIFRKEELTLLFGALAAGLLAAVIPAIQASKTDISETLSSS